MGNPIYFTPESLTDDALRLRAMASILTDAAQTKELALKMMREVSNLRQELAKHESSTAGDSGNGND